MEKKAERTKNDAVEDTEQVAERIVVSPKTIRDWLRMGKLKGVRAGRLWRIREGDRIVSKPDRQRGGGGNGTKKY